MLFLIGSAIVAFSGWPQVGVGPATSNISAAPLAATSRASRRLTVALAVFRRPAATHGRALTHAGVAPRTQRPAVHRRTAVSGVGTGSVHPGPMGTSEPTSASGAAPGGSPASAARQCGSCGGQKPARQPASKVTKTVSSVASDAVKTVSNVGNAVGQTITNATGAVGQQVDAVSPPAVNVASSAGSTIGQTVTGTVNTATNAVNSLTGALGVSGH